MAHQAGSYLFIGRLLRRQPKQRVQAQWISHAAYTDLAVGSRAARPVGPLLYVLHTWSCMNQKHSTFTHRLHAPAIQAARLPRNTGFTLTSIPRSCTCPGRIGAGGCAVHFPACNRSRYIMLRVCANQLRLAAPQAVHRPSLAAPACQQCLPKRWLGTASALRGATSKRSNSLSVTGGTRLVTMAAAATLYDFQAKVRLTCRCWHNFNANTAVIVNSTCVRRRDCEERRLGHTGLRSQDAIPTSTVYHDASTTWVTDICSSATGY
jgi:hypothetical protein